VIRESELISGVVTAVTASLPRSWRVERSAPHLVLGPGPVRVDAMLRVVPPHGAVGTVVVEAKASVTPRAVEVVAQQVRALAHQLQERDSRTAMPPSAVVAAPWLSPRTRGLLEAAGVGYVDLTGNMLLRMDQPAVFVRTVGAEKDPAPAPRGEVTLRGMKAGRVVRLLADVAPPYTPTDVSSRAGVSLPYASRLLTMLDREALVSRGPRGRVEHVEWADLLRRRAEDYDVFTTNRAHRFIAPAGASTTSETLRQLTPGPTGLYRAVTGSFAIGDDQDRVAAPNQLVVYVDSVSATAAELGLLPADDGADVVLLSDFDFAVVDRYEHRNGYRVVGSSQLVLDCLTGNGRLPAEGEALIDWMRGDPRLWRIPDIHQVEPRAPVFP
jgi:hypothetical protein